MNRKQYVHVDTYNSSVIDSLPCSVIQGSKLSSLLYIIYTNEIPYLHKFITDNKYNIYYNKITNNTYKITFENCKNLHVDHLTINYIDDSTNLISNTSSKNLIKYLTLYYNLLQHYYDSNKLIINT